MSDPLDENSEKRLRDILGAEAASAQPSVDGLDRIRARTEKKSLPWFGLAWLRPAVAVGAAVLIVCSVIIGTPQIRESILPGTPVAAESESPPPPDPEPSVEEEPPAQPVPEEPPSDTEQNNGQDEHEGQADPTSRPDPEESGMALSCADPSLPPTRMSDGEQGVSSEDREDQRTAEECTPDPGPSTDPTEDPDGGGDGDTDEPQPDPSDDPGTEGPGTPDPGSSTTSGGMATP